MTKISVFTILALLLMPSFILTMEDNGEETQGRAPMELDYEDKDVNWNNLPNELQQLTLSFVVKTEDVMSAINTNNYKAIPAIFKQWATLISCSKNTYALGSDKSLFDVEKLIKILALQYCNNYQDWFSEILTNAAKHGCVNILELVLSLPSDELDAGRSRYIDSCKRYNILLANCLVIASQGKHFEFCQKLFEAGILKNVENESLVRAIYLQQYREIAALVENNDNHARLANGSTELMMAVEIGNIDIIRLFLDNSEINVANKYGFTALMFAAKGGDKEVVELLLDRGADVHQKDECRMTALIFASEKGHKAVVELLLDRGADIHQKNMDNETALMLASANGHKEVVELLLDRSADIQQGNKNGKTALMFASDYGHKKVAGFLLDRGANIHQGDKNGKTALMFAALRGDKEAVELLLDRGAAINVRDKYGITALMLAAERGHKEVVMLLLARGADINQKSCNNWTALTYASYAGRKNLVEFLLDNGAAVIEGGSCSIALVQALQFSFVEIAALLQDSGATIENK